MRFLILGPQGSGKGTQGKKIAEKLEIPHVSTGDIFRDNIKQETELGKKVKKIIDSGNLVPDDLTLNVVKDRLSRGDCLKGFILDGFPRNIEQAKALDNIIKMNVVIDLEIPDSEVINRLEGRRTCTNKECGAIYNLNTSPKPNAKNKCDKCGSSLFQRDDDKRDAIQKRLEIYHELTSPLIKFYQDQGNLIRINGLNSIDKVFNDIIKKIS